MPDAEFQDPLENYDPKEYEEPLERALAEERVGEVSSGPYETISPGTPIRDAIATLAASEIACVAVAEDGKLVGMFSEWDVLNKVALEYDEIADHPVSEVMTADPFFVHRNDSVAKAMTIVALLGYRHVPVLDGDGRVVGIVGPRRIGAFLESRALAEG